MITQRWSRPFVSVIQWYECLMNHYLLDLHQIASLEKIVSFQVNMLFTRDRYLERVKHEATPANISAWILYITKFTLLYYTRKSGRICHLQIWLRENCNSWPLTGIGAEWASYQIRKIAGCACAGNAGNVLPRRQFQRKPLVSDPGMHHGTWVTHVPWCMSG